MEMVPAGEPLPPLGERMRCTEEQASRPVTAREPLPCLGSDEG